LVSRGALRAAAGADSRATAARGDWRGCDCGFSGRNGRGARRDARVYRTAALQLFACFFFFATARHARRGACESGARDRRENPRTRTACSWREEIARISVIPSRTAFACADVARRSETSGDDARAVEQLLACSRKRTIGRE